jgi:perosamine synthetase
MIPIARPLLGEEEKQAVLDVLDSGMLAQGEKVKEFEKAWAKVVGVGYAVATSNGTTALHAALLGHEIGPGDQVITSPFSFIATGNVIKMVGATPVFVDISEETFNINIELIEQAITEKTKAIMPVHLYGNPVEMSKIMAIAEKYNLAVIEDACQAHGAGVDRKVGSYGTGCFSFYPTKNMTTGEGGIITTNNLKLAEKLRKIISHGEEKKYHHHTLGYNFRMNNIAAAIGLAQLSKLSEFTIRRRENAEYLRKGLQDLQGVILPKEQAGHVYHQFTIRITSEFGKTREEVAEFLKEKGIGTAIFYPIPIHKQRAYGEYTEVKCPIAEKVAREVLSLPVHPGVSKEDSGLIIKTLQECQNAE